MHTPIEIFGDGQITLENGDTHDVQVLTRHNGQDDEEVAYVYDVELARLIAAAPDLLEALERLTIVANLISQRLHLLGRDMGYAGQYDGNYPCSAHHVELDMATHAAGQLLAKAKGA